MIFALVALAALFGGLLYWQTREHQRELAQIRLLHLEAMKEAAADVRALTEALVRKEGNMPLVLGKRAPLKPSPGWFDGKSKVEIKAGS